MIQSFKMSKKFYITTTLPYLNSDPHIGFALEIIQADAIARYKRLQGHEVFFNTGTDEHGAKIYEKAQERGLEPKEFCDRMVIKFKALEKVLDLSFDNFIRTTDRYHVEAAQEFWRRTNANGDIYKKPYRGRYCVGCELMKTDSELIDGRCPLHPNRELVIVEEENYFFRFSKYQKPLLEFYKENPNFVVPKERYNEIKKFVEGGLEDFSISRLKERLPWGIPVPEDEEQVFYVWFDALVNYISALGWPRNEEMFNSFWPGTQVAGKDNLRQQTAMWQAMLMSAGLPNSRQVLIHGFITSGGQKMSKSIGNVIDPVDLVDKYGVDPVRYFFLREISPFQDGDFSYKRFKERYNSDLANGLGNLVSRVLTMAEERFKGEIKYEASPYFKNLFDKILKRIERSMAEFRFNEALEAIWVLIADCDRHIDKERPWENESEKILKNLLAALFHIAYFLIPFLPNTSKEIINELGADNIERPNSFKIKKNRYLFPRIQT